MINQSDWAPSMVPALWERTREGEQQQQHCPPLQQPQQPESLSQEAMGLLGAPDIRLAGSRTVHTATVRQIADAVRQHSENERQNLSEIFAVCFGGSAEAWKGTEDQMVDTQERHGERIHDDLQ